MGYFGILFYMRQLLWVIFLYLSYSYVTILLVGPL